jgi:hypothetical protein
MILKEGQERQIPLNITSHQMARAFVFYETAALLQALQIAQSGLSCIRYTHTGRRKPEEMQGSAAGDEEPLRWALLMPAKSLRVIRQGGPINHTASALGHHGVNKSSENAQSNEFPKRWLSAEGRSERVSEIERFWRASSYNW